MYPLSTPGGWYLIGRTAERLFDPSEDPPTLLQAGDLVRFTQTDTALVEADPVAAEAPAATAIGHEHSPKPTFEVLAPGPMTSVQDRGRRGYAR